MSVSFEMDDSTDFSMFCSGQQIHPIDLVFQRKASNLYLTWKIILSLAHSVPIIFVRQESLWCLDRGFKLMSN